MECKIFMNTNRKSKGNQNMDDSDKQKLLK